MIDYYCGNRQIVDCFSEREKEKMNKENSMHTQFSKKSKSSRFVGVLFLSVVLSMFSQTGYAQCTDCTTTNPGNLSSYFYPASTKVCYTTGTQTVSNNVSFGNGGNICISPGATLQIETANNGAPDANNNFTIDVYGNLIFTGGYTFKCNITINVHAGLLFIHNYINRCGVEKEVI